MKINQNSPQPTIHNLRPRLGFSVLEIVLAAALFLITTVGLIGITLQAIENNRQAQEETIASQYASEGIEALHSIRNRSYALLTNTLSSGVASTSGFWNLAGTNNTFGKFTRTITISNALRDGSNNIVASGGSGDPHTKKVSSTVTWRVTPGRNNTLTFTEYLTNFRRARSGILVYGNGSTTTDAMQYQIMDPFGSWSAANAMADVDGGSTNRAVRAIRVYASQSRNEKVAVSRHYDGSVQYIYAQVFNGTAWGNVQLLSSWTANTFLDVQNFDGTYLSSGDFMVVFSDNTTTPKMRTWNGTSWSAQSSLTVLGAGAIPNYIVTKVRDATNEVMAAFFTQSPSTVSQYWSGSAWSAVTSHSTAAPVNTKRFVDFDWSPNNSLIGMIVYPNANNSRAITGKIWTANGSGGGAWSAAATTANQGVGGTRLGSVAVVGRPGATVFEACSDNTATQIVCYESNSTPAWSNPTNQTITTTTPGVIQRDFHLGFESQSGSTAIIIFSDNTTTPKVKKYSASTTTWDAAATSITTSGTPGVFQSFRIVPHPLTNDLMTVMADANRASFSNLWDGTTNAMYTTPSGFAYLGHGTNGSATTDYWYDFAWDGN